MLCRTCRVHVRRDFPYCLHCGAPRPRVRVDRFVAPVLVPVSAPLHAPVALTAARTTLGRAADCDVVLDDPSVSRRHACVVRQADRFVLEDTGSLNGTRVGDRLLRGSSAALTDGAVVALGDVVLRFDQPRPVAVGSRTLLGARETALRAAGPPVLEAAPEAAEPLSAVPRLRSGWALKQVPGEQAWVLGTRDGGYLRLDERQAFVFRCIDGRSTVRDLLFRYAQAYGELALPRIEAALHLFAAHGLVDGLGGVRADGPRGWRRVGGAVVRAVLKAEVSVSGLDDRLTALYRAGGWRAFTRTGVLLVWLAVVGGLWAFAQAQEGQRLLDVAGAGWWGAAVVAAGYVVALALHELAHALAVKSYGRRVRRGGFMLVLGMPFAFVDTSDMWFGTRWSRVVVALSGPVSTAALAGVASAGALLLPGAVAPALCFQLAFGLYLNTAYNLNPVVPLDGYQAITDALRVPRLRQEATSYLVRGLWRDLRAGRRPGVRQAGLAVYGLMVVVGTGLVVLLAVVAWRHRLGPLVDEHVPASWQVPLAVTGAALLAAPLAARAVRRRRARTGTPQDPASLPQTAQVPA